MSDPYDQALRGNHQLLHDLGYGAGSTREYVFVKCQMCSAIAMYELECHMLFRTFGDPDDAIVDDINVRIPCLQCAAIDPFVATNSGDRALVAASPWRAALPTERPP